MVEPLPTSLVDRAGIQPLIGRTVVPSLLILTTSFWWSEASSMSPSIRVAIGE